VVTRCNEISYVITIQPPWRSEDVSFQRLLQNKYGLILAGTAYDFPGSSETSPNSSKSGNLIEWFKGRIEVLESGREKDATKIMLLGLTLK
jgi:hypothetical protein